LALAWITTPARRGSLRQRWRDLKSPAASLHPNAIDLSRAAAARLVALRVGSLVKGAAYILFVYTAVVGPTSLLALLAVLSAVWIHNHWPQAANLVHYVIAKDFSIAFSHRGWRYLFPSYRRGMVANLLQSWPSRTILIFGLTFLMVAGLPLAYNSDTLATGIPGVSIRHTGLPWWQLGLIFFGAGVALTSLGIRLERRTRRAAMRRETTLVPDRRSAKPPIVFLRPFGSETLTVPAHTGPRQDGYLGLVPRRSEFLEDVATWLLWSRAEVVAVADPRGTRLPTLGASHHPMPANDDWQKRVAQLLERAEAIMLLPGPSPSIRWEIERVMHNPELARKALFLNPDPSGNGLSFLQSVNASPALATAIRGAHLRPVGAVTTASGPKVLCSSVAEDIDIETVVEWFLREHLPPPQKGGLLTSLLGMARRSLTAEGAASRA
jgi:hypothetical protein